ncbi:MAG: CehA/McbA family metallohydrolase [Candidatus Eisenbacteria bacterium]
MLQSTPRQFVRRTIARRHPAASPLARRAALACLLLLASLACLTPVAKAQQQYRLGLEIRDDQGEVSPARVRIYGADQHCHPESLDADRMTHAGQAGYYFYANGSAWVNVPGGPTRITVGRGFEYKAVDTFLYVNRDTTLQVTLSRWVDLGAEGWFSSDLHAHTQHPPVDYEIDPAVAKWVTRAEGISILHSLDNSYQFTGAPHPLSDTETILYYTVEYRNQSYGHVPIPGLRQYIFPDCCLPPEPAYPMILDIRNQVVPGLAPMIVLTHPHSTDDYFYDEGWPGAGLGRELPVLAALGGLDALDVVSYGNNPFEDWKDWYDVLSCGIFCPPSAGTDARPQSYTMPPIGGWRVYSRVPPGTGLDYNAWIEAYKAGRSFVTNYPLIPEFTIDGIAPGDSAIRVDAESFQPTVRVRALCPIGLTRIILQADGQPVWTGNVASLPVRTVVDTTFTVELPTPGWMNVVVFGRAGNPHAALGTPQAQTSAVMIHKNGVPKMSTAAAGRFLDDLTNLRTFVIDRGGWHAMWERDTVLARISRSERFYRRAFVIPPGPFALLEPGEGDTLYVGDAVLTWEAATDPEPGDTISYTVTFAQDSLFTHPIFRKVPSTSIDIGPLLMPGTYFWYVAAVDRNGNTTISDPPRSRFVLLMPNSAIGDGSGLAAARPRAWPNPSLGAVHLAGFPADRAAIFDVTGRRVAWLGRGIRRNGLNLLWDGTIEGGHRAPPGIYWARGRGDRPLRLIQLR